MLEPDILLDARLVGGRCASGTIVAISVNCGKAQEVDAAENDASGLGPLDRFKDVFGRGRVSVDVREDDLYGKRFAKLSREIINNEIQDAVLKRNSQGGPNYTYRHIVSFNYKDDAPMTTVVGIIFSDDEREFYDRCHFNRLDFMRAGHDLIDIQVPMLTIKELRYLEKQLPIDDPAHLLLEGDIPQKEANAFARLYRYLPNFATLEV